MAPGEKLNKFTTIDLAFHNYVKKDGNKPSNMIDLSLYMTAQKCYYYVW